MLTLLSLLSFAAASSPTSHTFYLSSGETLSHYASWSGLSVDAIEVESGLDSSGVYAVGTPIVLPISMDAIPAVSGAREAYLQGRFEEWSMDGNVYNSSYTVQPGDSAWSIAEEYGIDVWHLKEANPTMNLELLLPNQTLMVPIKEEYGC